MKELTEEEQALKDLIENSEKIYRSFHDVLKTEIPRKPNGLEDTRIHRIEGIWHEMRLEAEKAQANYIKSTIESYEDDAYKEAFCHSKERK